MLSEAVMWLWMLGDAFKALALVVGEDRARLNGLFFARHKGLHDAIALSSVSDQFSGYLTEMLGSPVWADLPPARSNPKNQREEADTGGCSRAVSYWTHFTRLLQRSERRDCRGRVGESAPEATCSRR